MVSLVLSVVYFLTGIFFIVSHYSALRLPGFFLKASIIPVLIIIFVVNRNAHWCNTDTLMLMALVFSWLGDMMLAGKSSGLFKAGLASFMLTHILYLLVFISSGNNFILRRSYILIILLIYGALLTVYLYNRLGRMKIPVIVYSTVIIAMLAGAVNRYNAVPPASFKLVLAGAILFVLSDSVLAINKFRRPFRLYQLVVMLTYVTAQFLIVHGYLREFSEF